MNTITFLCEDTVDGIFTAIYLAWQEGTSHTDVKVQCEDTYSLFTEYVYVDTDPSLARKVASSIRKKLSEEVYEYTYLTALSCDTNKASYIYHFLIKAFRVGKDIVNYLHDESVMKVFELCRNIRNESHRYIEFIRFEESQNNILRCRIAPKNNVVPLTAPHFADRLHNENWIILDTKRNFAAVHRAGAGYIFTNDITEEILMENTVLSEKELEYQKLWKSFFNTIAIKERYNPNLQRNLMPLHYRTYMNLQS